MQKSTVRFFFLKVSDYQWKWFQTHASTVKAYLERKTHIGTPSVMDWSPNSTLMKQCGMILTESRTKGWQYQKKRFETPSRRPEKYSQRLFKKITICLGEFRLCWSIKLAMQNIIFLSSVFALFTVSLCLYLFPSFLEKYKEERVAQCFCTVV